MTYLQYVVCLLEYASFYQYFVPDGTRPEPCAIDVRFSALTLNPLNKLTSFGCHKAGFVNPFTCLLIYSYIVFR